MLQHTEETPEETPTNAPTQKRDYIREEGDQVILYC